MKFEDLVTFAKAGYKPSEVKELLELQVESEKEPLLEDKEPLPEDKEPLPEDKEPLPEDKEPEVDYKKLYEETQEKLKEAQKANVTKDVSNSEDEPSDEDIVKDLFRSFM